MYRRFDRAQVRFNLRARVQALQRKIQSLFRVFCSRDWRGLMLPLGASLAVAGPAVGGGTRLTLATPREYGF
jgi:hypothetical protein